MLSNQRQKDHQDTSHRLSRIPLSNNSHWSSAITQPINIIGAIDVMWFDPLP